MSKSGATLSRSDLRRDAVVDAAIVEFARTGYHGTPITTVAATAQISPAYVFKLFEGKVALFVAALERCFEQIAAAMSSGAARAAADATPEQILYDMGGAYAELIGDKNLLMLQVHALSVADVPEIRQAMRDGLAKVTDLAKQRSGAEDDLVQRYIAFGQLCHLITTLDLDGDTSPWAQIVTKGIRHPQPR
ncbi:TetR family transcriptional regulator [Nocardia neocaledoniensis NBRC 108232]|uniref:TetR family transcriptional regulator n=1 Tax=Nocardia neocaledoniensis TaxID=236511 RepID=A0A317N1G3_9NOCA|nr:TetR/AcrR family transcriptional regulator [Nocardia neocaledoniensis]PWV67734.1 TetR family transcriptional regulator [Nocardia neocaledoniensis]GEM32845.1 TetR family transcriptional regulator [Nocardia neocaledoniensis NBRC 108232]